MDCIDEHLTTSTENMQYSAAIHSALAISKCTLNHYHNKTDQSEIYHIAMGKLWYFQFFPLIPDTDKLFISPSSLS